MSIRRDSDREFGPQEPMTEDEHREWLSGITATAGYTLSTCGRCQCVHVVMYARGGDPREPYLQMIVSASDLRHVADQVEEIERVEGLHPSDEPDDDDNLQNAPTSGSVN